MNTQRTLILVLLATLAGGLVACGSDSAAGSADASTQDNGLATAAQVAAKSRGDVDCPADIDTPAAPPGTPVDDIQGVRPGLTYAEAVNVVECTNSMLVITPAQDRGFKIKTYGMKPRWGFTARLAEHEKTSQQIMQEMRHEQQARMMNAVTHDLKPGEEKWFVSTIGMPGKEHVIAAARDKWFAKSKNPTVASLTQALIKKYGKPTRRADQRGAGKLVERVMFWAYDPRDRRITETSPLYGHCGGFAHPSDGFGLSPSCGIVVSASIRTLRKHNDALARNLAVGVLNQAAGYKALQSTEQGLHGMDVARRAKEIKKAGQNADAAQL